MISREIYDVLIEHCLDYTFKYNILGKLTKYYKKEIYNNHGYAYTSYINNIIELDEPNAHCYIDKICIGIYPEVIDFMDYCNANNITDADLIRHMLENI